MLKTSIKYLGIEAVEDNIRLEAHRAHKRKKAEREKEKENMINKAKKTYLERCKYFEKYQSSLQWKTAAEVNQKLNNIKGKGKELVEVKE